MIDFSEDELLRYSRNILVQDIGVEGQERIRRARVLVIGAGGIGSPVLLYLAAAGVGTLGIADGDRIDLSNLQRQILFTTADAGNRKAECAAERVHSLNPGVKTVVYPEYLDASNIADIIKDYDFIIDGTDNYAAKYLINDACVLHGKAFSHGGVVRFGGQVMTHVPGSACFRCVFGEPPAPEFAPTCAQAGVLGAVVGIVGSIQATEALKYITGAGELLVDRLLTIDASTMAFHRINIAKNPECPLCGSHPAITTLTDYELPHCNIRDNGNNK